MAAAMEGLSALRRKIQFLLASFFQRRSRTHKLEWTAWAWPYAATASGAPTYSIAAWHSSRLRPHARPAAPAREPETSRIPFHGAMHGAHTRARC